MEMVGNEGALLHRLAIHVNDLALYVPLIAVADDLIGKNTAVFTCQVGFQYFIQGIAPGSANEENALLGQGVMPYSFSKAYDCSGSTHAH